MYPTRESVWEQAQTMYGNAINRGRYMPWNPNAPVIRPVGMGGMGQEFTTLPATDQTWWQKILGTIAGVFSPGGSYPYPYPTTYPPTYPGGGTYPYPYQVPSSQIDWTTVLLIGGGIFLVATMNKKKKGK